MLLRNIRPKNAEITIGFLIFIAMIVLGAVIIMLILFPSFRNVVDIGNETLTDAPSGPFSELSEAIRESDLIDVTECDPPAITCTGDRFCNIDKVCEPKRDVGIACGTPHPSLQARDTCLTDYCYVDTCEQFFNDCTDYCASLEEFQDANLDSVCVIQESACEFFRNDRNAVRMSVKYTGEEYLTVHQCRDHYCCCMDLG